MPMDRNGADACGIKHEQKEARGEARRGAYNNVPGCEGGAENQDRLLDW